jgi:hypothetical protein
MAIYGYRGAGVLVEPKFKLHELILELIIKVVSLSTIKSLFEKPKFRDFACLLPPNNKKTIASGLENTFHGKELFGFETVLEFLQFGKLGKRVVDNYLSKLCSL